MALPETAPVVNCTLSKPLMAEGTVGVIKSAFLKVDRDLVWADTGETIYKESVPIVVGTAGTLQFSVIPVDVDGVLDTAGAEVKFWSYTLRVTLTLPNSVERTVDYVFQPPHFAGDVDLDLVPHLGVSSIPPIPPITDLTVLDGGLL